MKSPINVPPLRVKPELVCPAGSLPALKAAVEMGLVWQVGSQVYGKAAWAKLDQEENHAGDDVV